MRNALESRRKKAYPVLMNVRTPLGVLLLFSAVCTMGENPPEYTPAEAPRHIGETASVTGAVKQVYQTQGGSIFLDLGAIHPHNPFTVFIPRSAAEKFSNFKDFDGMVITVSGQIQEYNNKAEIVVTDPSQITRGSVPGL
jgi:DNA/RNA endonuclease YhcR with UshA esterase domain